MRFNTKKINAIVLAGGINRIALYDGYLPGYKALLPVNNKPLITYTLDALRNCPETDRICIVGPVNEIKNVIADNEAYEYEECTESLIANVRKGLLHFQQSPVILVTTADLPLATSTAISRFLSACACLDTRYNDSIFWSMVPEEQFRGIFVKVKKGFNRFSDISVCHGNLFTITPSLAMNSCFGNRLERIYAGRKSTIRAGLAVGARVGLWYLFGVHLFRFLTLSKYADIASQGFRVGLIPVVIDEPGIAVDIDEKRDYLFIQEVLNGSW